MIGRNTICAAALAAGLFASPSLADGELPSRVCLAAERLDNHAGMGNFAFSGRVTGNETVPHHGYWVLARDASNNYWAQNGGGVVKNGGKVEFGVSNISTYPIKFVVARVASGPDFVELKDLAAIKRPLDAKVMQGLVITSPEESCIFEIFNGDKINGVPENHGDTCRCR